MEDSAVRNYPVPYFDNLRVRNLQRLHLLDTKSDPLFDELVRLSALVSEMPIAAISLVDQERQWFKAKVGLEVSETSRDVAFCAHTIMNPNAPFIVTDATKSEIFKANPLVTGEMGIRAYVGFPIESADGFTIGSLCVIDTVPRELSHTQLSILKQIASAVTKAIQTNRV